MPDEEELFKFPKHVPARDKDMIIYHPGKGEDQDTNNLPDLRELKDWEREAFYFLYDKPRTDMSIRDIADKVGKSREWVSKFYNSDSYKTLCRQFNERRQESLTGIAIDVVQEVLLDKRAPAAVRANIAFKIKDAPVDPRKSPGLNPILNIFNIERMMGMDLNDISGMKEKLIKDIKAELANEQKTVDGEVSAVEIAGASGDDTEIIQ